MSTTLAEVEQEVARRTGPYQEHAVSALVTSTTTQVYVDLLKTTLTLGGYKGQWLVRRGLMSNGTAVPGYVASDRLRRVVNWNTGLGYLQVDNPYTVAPPSGELVEVCYLDPAQVIRPAVLAGLKRCFVEDRVTVTLSSAATERDLTAVLPWLVKRSQVRGVFYKEASSLYDPVPVSWSKTFYQGGHVWITIAPDVFPQTLYLQVDRPADTLVNGVDSTIGPTTDTDVLAVPIEYAAAAGHIECWRAARPLLQNVAQAGYALTQAQTADEFTRQQRRHVTRRPTVIQLSRPLYAVRV